MIELHKPQSGAPPRRYEITAKRKKGTALLPSLFCVRPAWARSYGCESRRKLVTVNEVKRNCMRVTECGEEAWIETAGR